MHGVDREDHDQLTAELASRGALAVVRGQVEFIVLTDEVDAEAVVRRFVDESEAGSKVKMA